MVIYMNAEFLQERDITLGSSLQKFIDAEVPGALNYVFRGALTPQFYKNFGDFCGST